MKWYIFRQNNSGGKWKGPSVVYVQAKDADEANDLAVESGVIYFDNECRIDCECCGPRWTEASDWYDWDSITFVTPHDVYHGAQSWQEISDMYARGIWYDVSLMLIFNNGAPFKITADNVHKLERWFND